MDKVYFITTDGAGEYVAAFKYFGDNYRSIQLLDASDEHSDSELDIDNPDDDPDSFVRVFSEAESESDESHDKEDSVMFTTHELPPSAVALLANMNRVDCAAHKLDKIGKCDVNLAKGEDANYDEYHDRVFDKLHKIWNSKDSRLCAEEFTRITGKKLIGPHRIRWFKTCEAVSAFFHFFCN